MGQRWEQKWYLRVFAANFVVVAGCVASAVAGDQFPSIDFNFKSFVVPAADIAPVPAQENTPEVIPPRLIEIGGFGEPKLPDNVRKMMKAAEEIQAIRTKYDAAVAELIDTARTLDKPDEQKADPAVVAALANTAAELRQQLERKQKEMMTNLGGGGELLGGEIELDNDTDDAGAVEIFPQGLLPRFDP